MKLGTANIRNHPDMPPRQVRDDARTVAAHTTLAGLQEIQPWEDTEPVVQGLEHEGPAWWIVGGQLEVPIVGRQWLWEHLATNVIPFHRPKLPLPQNPKGGVVSVVVKSRKRPKLPPFAVVNTHLVNGGMNHDQLPLVKARWWDEWAIYRDEALRLWQQGLTVYMVGDLNAHRPPTFGSPAMGHLSWLNPNGTPDHVGQLVHPHGARFGRTRVERVKLHSDHDLQVVRGALHRARATR